MRRTGFFAVVAVVCLAFASPALASDAEWGSWSGTVAVSGNTTYDDSAENSPYSASGQSSLDLTIELTAVPGYSDGYIEDRLDHPGVTVRNLSFAASGAENTYQWEQGVPCSTGWSFAGDSQPQASPWYPTGAFAWNTPDEGFWVSVTGITGQLSAGNPQCFDGKYDGMQASDIHLHVENGQAIVGGQAVSDLVATAMGDCEYPHDRRLPAGALTQNVDGTATLTHSASGTCSGDSWYVGGADWPVVRNASMTVDLTFAPEGGACNDGQSNDFDGLVDFPLDTGCSSATDPSELGTTECDNGDDDDSDGQTDWPLDSSCADTLDDDERGVTACSDGVDSDEIKDGLADGADPGCSGSDDDSEYDEVRLEVRVDGPGSVSGAAGDCNVACSRSVPRGAQVSVQAEPLEPLDGFLGWSGCVGFGGLTCHVTMSGPVSLVARFDPVVSYAPWLRFHPDEKRWPMDPEAFVKRSALKWHNGPPVALGRRGAKRYRACSKKTVTVVPQGRVNAGALSRGEYKHRYCYRDRRGRKLHKTFDTNDLTSPSIKRGKYSRSGFYLDLDNDLRKGIKPGSAAMPPMYVEYVPGRYVIYWFFSGQNFAKVGGVKDLHEGDWEHIVVRLNDSNQATQVSYYQHYCGGDTFDWDGTFNSLTSKNAIKGMSHPAVYVALGAHASYPDSGRHPISCSNPFKGVGDKTANGLVWETWQNGSDGFRRADAQPWYGFGGGWGSQAESTKGFPGPFWGPLGPGPLKFADGGAIPGGW